MKHSDELYEVNISIYLAELTTKCFSFSNLCRFVCFSIWNDRKHDRRHSNVWYDLSESPTSPCCERLLLSQNGKVDLEHEH